MACQPVATEQYREVATHEKTSHTYKSSDRVCVDTNSRAAERQGRGSNAPCPTTAGPLLAAVSLDTQPTHSNHDSHEFITNH